MNIESLNYQLVDVFNPKVNVLIVENDPVLQKRVVSGIRKWCHEIDIAMNYEFAADLLNISNYDLIIVDLQTNENDLLSFLRELKESKRPDFKNLKFLVLTDEDDPLLPAFTSITGIKDHYIKQNELKGLTAKVVNMIHLSQN